MDIQIVGSNTLKLKTKKTTLAVDPLPAIQKFDADAIIVTNKDFSQERINNYRVIIDAEGEYEVSGLKISGISSEGDTIFTLNSENTPVLIAKASSLGKFSTEKIGEYKILILNADAELKESMITAMEPSVVVLYGEKAKEGAKALGKETAAASSKITLTEDKLPEETDVVILA
jgi:hypothetical protein